MSFAEKLATFKLLHLSKPAGERILYQATRGQIVASVLEIGLADMQRTERLIAWLRAQGNVGPIRYAAIDDFEMSAERTVVTLKDFHRRLTALEVKPLPIPGQAEQGLARVANTLGAIDLAIIELDEQRRLAPIFQTALARVCHQQTIVLACSGPRSLGRLDTEEINAQGERRQAA